MGFKIEGITDIVGIFPVVGDVADITNGVIHLLRGNYFDAAMSLVGAIPFLGDLAGPLADLLKKLPDGTLKKIMELVEKFLKLCKKANYKLEKIIDGASCLIEDIFDEFLKGAKKVLSGGELFDGKKIDEIFDAIKDFFKKKHCFVGGTLVNTSIGLVAIEKIREGDLVYSKDEETGEEGLKRVTGTSEKEVYITYEIEFEKEVIVTTEEHQFWVYGKDFVQVSELLQGDEIVVDQDSEEYKLEEIKSIKRHLHEESIKVYNFVVEDWHTYFIGESRFWVHNKKCKVENTPNRPPNMSPEGAGRRGAFREAKRKNNIPMSQHPENVAPNIDRRGKRSPGRQYEFENKKNKDTKIVIREDSAGHIFPDDPSQNRGPHFNDEQNNHYDY